MDYSAFKDWNASEPLSENTKAEKLFLRELYSYMKKRDSPIERIPNLGFKQSKDAFYTSCCNFQIFWAKKCHSCCDSSF